MIPIRQLLAACVLLLGTTVMAVAVDYDALAEDDLGVLVRSYTDQAIVAEVAKELPTLDARQRPIAVILLGMAGDQAALTELGTYIRDERVPLGLRMKAAIPLALHADTAQLDEWLLAAIGGAYQGQWELAKQGTKEPPPLEVARIYTYAGLALSRLYQREFRAVVVEHMGSTDRMVRLGCVSMFLRGRGFPDDLKATAGYRWDSTEPPDEKVVSRWKKWLEMTGDSDQELAYARKRMFAAAAAWGKPVVPAEPVEAQIARAREVLAKAGTDAEIKQAALALEAILRKYDNEAWVDYPWRGPQPPPAAAWRREAVLETVNYIWSKMEEDRAMAVRDLVRSSAAFREREEFDMAKRRAHDRAATAQAKETYERELERAAGILARWQALLADKGRLAADYDEKRELFQVVGVAYLAPRAIDATTMPEWRANFLALFNVQDNSLITLEARDSALAKDLQAIISEVSALKGTVPAVGNRNAVQP